MRLRVISALLVAFASSSAALPCSTFVLRSGDRIVFGRNYDYSVGYGIVFQNQRHLRKTAFSTPAALLSWVSRYASLTCNQFGKEQPTDGMNEAGLVVALMMLNGTTYPVPDARPAVGCLAWIQYQLDNCGRVEEVIQTDTRLRIAPGSYPLHFLVCDALGDVAVIEFLDGRMVVYRGDTLPVLALTNNTYEQSIHYLRRHVGFGGQLPIPQSHGSLDRFVRLADRLAHYDPDVWTSPVDYAFSTLGSVAQGSFTRWTIVYDVSARAVYFKTWESPTVKVVPFYALDFRCTVRPKLLDIDYQGSGDVSQFFENYEVGINRDLISRIHHALGWPISDWALDALAAFPDSFRCNRSHLVRRPREKTSR
ncbi:MAG: linear amide C-N hydrolase [Acidobacteriota bacterium]